jgi:hypothetical protein
MAGAFGNRSCTRGEWDAGHGAEQQSKIVRIGLLRLDGPSGPAAGQAVRDFRQGLNDLGYKEGQKLWKFVGLTTSSIGSLH